MRIISKIVSEKHLFIFFDLKAQIYCVSSHIIFVLVL